MFPVLNAQEEEEMAPEIHTHPPTLESDLVFGHHWRLSMTVPVWQQAESHPSMLYCPWENMPQAH